jgi:hypothetical protein
MTRTEAGLFKDRILAHLKLYTTADHPRVSREFQHLWNISDVTVRQTMGLLRDDGEPIASGPKGFFYAIDPDELEPTIDNLGERIAVMTRRRALLIQCQIRMKEGDGGQRLLFSSLR